MKEWQGVVGRGGGRRELRTARRATSGRRQVRRGRKINSEPSQKAFSEIILARTGSHDHDSLQRRLGKEASGFSVPIMVSGVCC